MPRLELILSLVFVAGCTALNSTPRAAGAGGTSGIGGPAAGGVGGGARAGAGGASAMGGHAGAGAATGKGGGGGTAGAGGTVENPDASSNDAAVDARGSAVAPPRLIAPLSTASVTSQRPTLRWALAAGTDGVHVQICRDRACTIELTSFDASGASAVPTTRLPAGVVFWRAYGRSAGATGTAPSSTWEMIVGALGAPVDTSWGTLLDVNGDGYADVVVGADDASSAAGQAFVYLGSATGLSSSPSATLSGTPGSDFGVSVASAGDVNGDGYADVIVGADGSNSTTGQAYLYLGGAAGLSTHVAAILTSPGSPGTSFGIAVASVGDVNSDGYADVIVGASGSTNPNGAAYLYLGGATGLSSSPTTSLPAPDSNGRFGASVASAGDINGDGYDDVIIGGAGFNQNIGRAYLYLGGAAGLSSSPTTTLTGPDGPGGFFGVSVASAGDVNGDGYADLIIGGDGVSSNTGRAYLYLGGAAGVSSSSSPTTTLTGPDGASGFFGASVAGAGDVNGDGYADVVVGAYATGNGTGRAYLYLGTTGGLSAISNAMLTGPDGASGRFGSSVAGAGDVNRDGYADVIIGAYATGNGTGRAYLFGGRGTGLSSSPTTTFTGPGGAGGDFGSSVASVGNVNNRRPRRT
jgi:FG-GAP-like repeat/FG-GAP repeat